MISKYHMRLSKSGPYCYVTFSNVCVMKAMFTDIIMSYTYISHLNVLFVLALDISLLYSPYAGRSNSIS